MKEIKNEELKMRNEKGNTEISKRTGTIGVVAGKTYWCKPGTRALGERSEA
ncbi:MAG TPA: hypothetical protein VGE79_17830 [Niastella sp.]